MHRSFHKKEVVKGPQADIHEIDLSGGLQRTGNLLGIRQGQSMEALAKLRTVFDRHNGTVTAGNASQITDGAAAVLVMSEERAKNLGKEPLGRIRSFAFAGLDPSRMGLGPSYATPAGSSSNRLKSLSDQFLAFIIVSNARC